MTVDVEILPAITDDLALPERFNGLDPKQQAFVLALLRTGGDYARAYWVAYQPDIPKPDKGSKEMKELREDFKTRGLMVWMDEGVQQAYQSTFANLIEPERASILKDLKQMSHGSVTVLQRDEDTGEMMEVDVPIGPKERISAAKAFLDATKPVLATINATQNNISFDGKEMAAMLQNAVQGRRKVERTKARGKKGNKK